MSKKWVISDLHFGHANILKYSGALRGGTTPEEHDDWIITQWNSVVKKGDLVYLLGDVAMDRESLKKVAKLKGMKILIRGNHDIESVQSYLEYFQQIYGLMSFKATFWLSHAPIHPGSLRGRINIHGHVHQNSLVDKKYINACVEASYGVPQSLDDLFEKHREAVWLNRKGTNHANEP